MADNYGLTLEAIGVEPPYSMQAEQSVLGAIILEPTAYDQVGRRLRPEMFFVRQNRAVFAEIHTLSAGTAPLDVVVLADRLASDAAFPSATEARAYLAELADTVPSISNAAHYADIVYEKYVKRLLMEQARETLEQARDDVESDLMLEAAEQRLYDIRAGRGISEVQPLKYAFIDLLTHLQLLSGPNREEYQGLRTGYELLDATMAGMGKGDFIILAARPGMGKTSFALNIATNVAQRGHPVIFFSLEMSNQQLAARILSAEARLDSRIFRNGLREDSKWRDLSESTERLAPLPIYLDDSSAITIPQMKSKIRQLNRDCAARGEKPVALVIIDYLQLMTTGRRNENRVQEISEITRNLKIMAKDLKVPVMTLSQLSRAPEKTGKEGGGRMPGLSDLRDSGSIEQDADVVLFLYRKAYYEDSPDVDQTDATLKIAKNRHGDTIRISMSWDGEHTRYNEVDYEHGDEG